jgi:SAM-dependent MidA family methyltransferase
MRAAWGAALYGPHGFYRRESPSDHFRTSAHVSNDFGAVVHTLAREHGVECVIDLGSGGGELLSALHRQAPDLTLVGVDVRPRPAGLARGITWRQASLQARDAGGDHSVDLVADAASARTMVVANELLDNVPCDVVELSADGIRDVEVESASGQERLGGPADPASVAWIGQWWPLDIVGQRAVVGLARDRWWSHVCSRVGDGVCAAIDFGHTLADRPAIETPTSYRRGRQYPPCFDARHDITAPVAVDAVASAVGGRIERQRDVLRRRVSPPGQPSVDLARSDPIGYLRQLSAVGDWRELTASAALGDFWWIESPRGPRTLAAGMGLESEVAR